MLCWILFISMSSTFFKIHLNLHLVNCKSSQVISWFQTTFFSSIQAPSKDFIIPPWDLFDFVLINSVNIDQLSYISTMLLFYCTQYGKGTGRNYFCRYLISTFPNIFIMSWSAIVVFLILLFYCLEVLWTVEGDLVHAGSCSKDPGIIS